MSDFQYVRIAFEFIAWMTLIRMTHMMWLYRDVFKEMKGMDRSQLAFDPKYSARFLVIVYAMVLSLAFGSLYSLLNNRPMNPFVFAQIIVMLAMYLNFGKMISTFQARKNLRQDGLHDRSNSTAG